MTSRSLIPIVTGPTASGKSEIVMNWILKQVPRTAEIINLDSIQLYRKFNLGSAKPTRAEQTAVPHHLIDHLAPEAEYSAAKYREESLAKAEELFAAGKLPVFVGGTPFYIKALIYGVWDAPESQPEFRTSLEPLSNIELHAQLILKDPTGAGRIGDNDRYRLIRALEVFEFSGKKVSDLHSEKNTQTPDPRFRVAFLDRDESDLQRKIEHRSRRMIENGLLDEVSILMKDHPTARALESVGYFECAQYLKGISPPGRTPAPGLEGLISEISLGTRQLSRKQRKFCRSIPHDAFQLDKDLTVIENWLDSFKF